MNYRHAYHAGNFADVLKHVDDHGMVDYGAIRADPARLNAYLAELANVKLEALETARTARSC